MRFLLLFVFNLSSLFYWVVLLLLRAGDVELNPGPQSRDVRLLYANIRGLHCNLSELSVASAGFDVIMCSETLVSNRRHLSEVRIAGFSGPQQRLLGSIPRARGSALYIREGVTATRQLCYECKCHEMMVVRICGNVSNIYVFAVYRNPGLDDSLYDCLLRAMHEVQGLDRKAAFIVLGDVNAHHVEWLGSSLTDRHGVAALDFCSLAGLQQLVNSPTHAGGNRLDLVMTDVPDVIDVSVSAPLGSSDHCFLSVCARVHQIVHDHTITRHVLLKHSVNWDSVREAVKEFSWSTIVKADDPVDYLNNLVLDVITKFIPSRVIKVRSRDKPWFDESCRRAFDAKQTAYRAWCRVRSPLLWNAYVVARDEAGAIFSRSEDDYKYRIKHTLNSAVSSKKWWGTLKESLFGASPSLPALRGNGGALVFDPAGKADLLGSHFDSKQNREHIVLPQGCFPEPECSSLAFRSSLVVSLLLDLDSGGGVDPVGAFPLFFKEVAAVFAPGLSRVFRLLIKKGSFPRCWRSANVTAIPKGALTQVVANYRPISITPILSKIFERLLASKIVLFAESKGLIPAAQFAYRKNLGCADALLSVTHLLQRALDTGQEGRVVQLDFSAAFDRVSHSGILFKLKSLGVGGMLLSICKQFLSHRTQRVVVDGALGTNMLVVSGVPQGSVLGPLLYVLYTRDLLEITSNCLVGYADDSTLFAVIPHPSDRPAVLASLQRDLDLISSWCAMWGMLLNASKTKALTISRSRTVRPLHGILALNGVAIKEVSSLVILGITLDSKLTFENHVRSVVSSVSRKIGILRLAWRVLREVTVVRRCFFAFVLPSLEYCSQVWGSAADTHLALLDRLVQSVSALCPMLQLPCLSHRRKVAGVCVFYKICNNSGHFLHTMLPRPFTPARSTRATETLHEFAREIQRCRTSQFQRCFIPAMVKLWNGLPSEVFQSGTLEGFKRACNLALL